MSGELVVLLDGRVAGRLTRSKGQTRLTYDPAWQEHPGAYPLSLSMPFTRREHPHAVVAPYLKNLLPDNDFVLARWAARFHVSATDPFGLLEHVGEDCAGAVQFCRPERVAELTVEPPAADVEWLSERGVAERLREVRLDPAAVWHEGAGYFSLAGAQPKIALFRDGDRWGVPSGRRPTNVILKPPTGEHLGFAVNEHVCLALAAGVGLRAASSRVERFGEEAAILVDRYDRLLLPDGRWARIHQEDLCQTLAVPPERKYESQGGPGIRAVAEVLRSRSTRSGGDLRRFIQAQALNWAIAGTDAHAKNFSLLIAPGQVRLAPLYDVISILAYPKAFPDRKARMAMRIGGEYHRWKIGRRHWERLAGECGLGAETVTAWVRGVIEKVPDQVVTVCSAVRAERLGEEAAMIVDVLEAAITEQAAKCLARLDRAADPEPFD